MTLFFGHCSLFNNTKFTDIDFFSALTDINYNYLSMQIKITE